MPLFKFSPAETNTVSAERPFFVALCESVAIGKTAGIEAELPWIEANALGFGFVSANLPLLLASVRGQESCDAVGYVPELMAEAVASVYGVANVSGILPSVLAGVVGENSASAILPWIGAVCSATSAGVAEVAAVLPHTVAAADVSVSVAGSIAAIIPGALAWAATALLGGSAFVSAEIPFYATRFSGLSGSYNFGSEDDEVLRYASSRRYI